MATEEETARSAQEELQQTLMYLETVKEQISTLKEQFEILDLAVREHNQAIDTLKSFKNIKKDNEVLIPIGADSMVFAKLSDASKVIINIGAGIAIEDKLDAAVKKLNTRIDKINENKEKINKTISSLQQQALALSQSIEERYQSLQPNLGNDKNLGQPNVS